MVAYRIFFAPILFQLHIFNAKVHHHELPQLLRHERPATAPWRENRSEPNFAAILTLLLRSAATYLEPTTGRRSRTGVPKRLRIRAFWADTGLRFLAAPRS